MHLWYLLVLFVLFRTRFTDYGNEAVLPFYILHQPVLLTIGYFVIPLAIPATLKWAVIMPASFLVIMILYEFGVRRVNVLRFLFGMKPLRRPAQSAAPKQPELLRP